eukprot:2133437-Amphidinium_carterae.1
MDNKKQSKKKTHKIEQSCIPGFLIPGFLSPSEFSSGHLRPFKILCAEPEVVLSPLPHFQNYQLVLCSTTESKSVRSHD